MHVCLRRMFVLFVGYITQGRPPASKTATIAAARDRTDQRAMTNEMVPAMRKKSDKADKHVRIDSSRLAVAVPSGNPRVDPPPDKAITVGHQ